MREYRAKCFACDSVNLRVWAEEGKHTAYKPAKQKTTYPDEPTAEDKIAKAQKIWRKGWDVKIGSPVWHYLTTERRVLDPNDDVPPIFRQSSYFFEGYAALIACTTKTGNIEMVQSILLNHNGSKREFATRNPENDGYGKPTTKRSHGYMQNGVWQLVRKKGATVFAYTEGIETALAYRKLRHEPCDVASVISAGWVDRTPLPSLQKYKQIIIAFDGDQAGERATQKRLDRLETQRKKEIAKVKELAGQCGFTEANENYTKQIEESVAQIVVAPTQSKRDWADVARSR